MKNRGYITSFVCCLIVLTGFVHGLGSELSENRELFDLSLDELLDMNIVTATRSSQRISEAPVIIDAYTHVQLAEMGIENLYEFLSMLPGIEIIETYYGYTDVQFRGILQSHYNNKSSLLLNGQPLYDQVVSTFYLEQIPLAAIQRIEVIRGPGGVLNGTNAFAGVINVITKTGEDTAGGDITVTAGDFNTRRVSLATGHQQQGWDFFIGGEFNDSDGYGRLVEWDEDDLTPGSGGHSFGSRRLGYYPDDPDAYENDCVNLFGSVMYRNLALNLVYFKNQKDKMGLIPTLASTGERQLTGLGVNLKYTWAFSQDQGQFTIIGWADRINKVERVNRIPPKLIDGIQANNQEYEGQKTGAQFEIAYTFSQRLNLLTGAGYESSRTEPYRSFYTDSLALRVENEPASSIRSKKETTDYWAFSQWNYRPADRLSFFGGARFNHNQQAGSIFVPSFSFVFSPAHRLSCKILYGKGFRNPSFYEKYARTVNVVAGDNDLESETIDTFDVGIDFVADTFSLRLNAFYTETDQTIQTVSLDAPTIDALNAEADYGYGYLLWTGGQRYINAPGKTYHGIELAVQGSPFSKLHFFANLSFKQGEDQDDNDLQFFANWLANLGITAGLSSWVNWSGTVQYVGQRDGHYAPIWAWNQWTAADYTLDDYTIVNSKLTIQPLSSLSVSLINRNLFNTEYNYPEYIRQAIPYIPGGPGRAMYLSATYHFDNE